MKILFIGDIVGRPGRTAVRALLENLKREYKIDLCIANGENSAAGKGITYAVTRELFSYGIDVITMGNHVWDKKDVFRVFLEEDNIIRPANYPPNTPGTGYVVVPVGNTKAVVINICGRIYLEALDCPFRSIEHHLKNISSVSKIIIVDFHAEATSEKVSMGWFLDGRVSAVIGTHTHVQTADETILPGGTGYITDVGMTGPTKSVLGIEKNEAIARFITSIPRKLEVADTPPQFNAVVLNVDEITGKTTDIERIYMRNF